MPNDLYRDNVKLILNSDPTVDEETGTLDARSYICSAVGEHLGPVQT